MNDRPRRPSHRLSRASDLFPSAFPLAFQVPFEGTDEEIAAATKLQAIQRGRAARADVSRLKHDRDAAASAANETATAVAEAEAEAASARDAERTLEDEFEGTEDEQVAATKLQALQRGRLARARVAELKAEHLAAVARVAGAEAAIEFAGTEDEHIAATKVQAIQRGRVARAHLAAEKAAAAAKLADVDAKLAAKEGSENDAKEDPDLEALEAERAEAAEALEAAATKLQAMHRGRSAREHVEKLRTEKQAMEASASATAATADDAEAEVAAAAEEQETLDALVVAGDEDEKTLDAKVAAVRRGIAARARLASLRAEQFSAEARAHDAEADAVDAEHRGADEEEEEKDAAPAAEDGDPEGFPDAARGGAEDAPAAKRSAEGAHEESFDDEEEMWMTDEEKAALAERVAAKARRKAKTLHVKRAYDYAAATSTLARADARLAAADQKEADRICGDSALTAAEKLAALIETRRARDALEAAQAETVETERAEAEAADAADEAMNAEAFEASSPAEASEGAPEADERRSEALPEETEQASERSAEDASEDTFEDEAGRLVADRLEALRAVRSARAALDAAPDPDAPVPRKEYKPEEMRRAPGEDELSRDAITMHHSFGFESVKRNNLHYLSEEVIIFTVGAVVQTTHLVTGEQTYLRGVDGEGVGFVVVHPEKTHFALGEKGANPGVYIYETETLKLKRVLVGGTERAYSCGRFSNDGSKLATVGGYPDFWLTVWDWREEAIVLRSKAFSQEVFDVTFSPFFEGQLTTSGTGHIRFWKMAETFTGLKLQGDIGRFGNEDLSDVAGYAEMPDGKVLSGTESGRLLMWDGGLIRTVLLRPGGKPCHDGIIEFVRLEPESGRVYTAGADGYVRVWDYETLNDAEPGEDSAEAYVDALDEFLIPRGEPFLVDERAPRSSPDPTASEPASVKSLIMSEPDHWLVQDEKGGVVKVPLTESGAPDVRRARRVLDFHAGAVRALEASRVSDHVITAGEDGSVRVFAYAEKREVFAARFDAPATALSLAPPAVDAEGRVAIVGFGDGTARALLRCADAWKLVDAVKPHVGAVTCAAYAPAGRAGARPLLATAGEDKKVWFFSCEREKGTGLSPIGFVEAPGPVSALAWTEAGDAALVGCASGHVVELAAPAPGSVDTTRTFRFEPRRVRAYAFERPRASAASVLAAREGAPPEITQEMDPADVIEAKAARKRFDERAAELQEEMDEAEATAKYPVTHLAYDSGSSEVFELCVGGEARGKVFTCSLERPGKPLAARDAHAESVVTVVKTRLGASRDVEVSGAENGRVRVSRRGVEKHWRWEVHDGHRGAVSGAAVSRCGKFLITAAKDGSLFAQTLGPELRGTGPRAADGEPSPSEPSPSEPSPSEPRRTPADARDVVPSLEADATPAARDIDSATAYAIEDAKVKAEEDAKRAAAEEEKMGVRELLAKLKAEYAALARENDARPAAERLPAAAFEVDPGLREVIEAETLADLERCEKSLAWHCEKSSLGLRKLRERFLDDIEHERVALRSFATGRRAFATTSFRATKPSEQTEADLKALKEGGARLGPDGTAGGARRAGSSRARSNAGGSMRLSRSQNAREADPGGEPLLGEEENPFAAGHKQELRRRRRLAREEEWRRFNATKPDDAYENPEDVAAIEVAKRTLGDYKLKSDEHFAVAEEDSVNYGKKREQMLRLEASSREARRDFNARFAAMRETRAAVVREMVAGAARVAEITAAIGDAQTPEGAEALAAVGEPFRATPLADEYPTETRDEATEEALRAFDAERRAAAAAAAAKAAAKAGGGFGGGGDGGDGGDDAAGEEESVAKSADGEPNASAADAGDGDAPAANEKETPPARGDAAFEDETDSERAARTLRLRHERAVLVRNRLELPARFDEALRALRRHKSFVEGELKAAEIKKLTYNRELVSLKKFEDGEASLREKLSSRYAEQEDIEQKTHDVNAHMEDVEAELGGVNERKQKVLNEFDKFVDEEHARREYLKKIFLRRIKRVKRKDSADDARDEGDRPESEESDGDDDSDDDDDEYNSDDEMEESRPEDCDESLWEQILALRERRQDQDDVLNELAKRSAELKKEADALAKKDKAAGKALASLQEEMSSFQREKQETMNMIETTVSLRLRQVEYLYDGKLPLRLSEGVVFSRSNLEGLRARIDALVREKAALRATQRDLRREHAALRQDTAALTERNRALDDAATRMTMLRFGKRIDLEKMERALIPKKGIEELKVSLRETETAHRSELRRWDADLAEARRELTRATAENTAVLNVVSDLTQRKRELEARLKRTQSSVFVDPDAARREEAAERERMAAVVDAQAAEIDTLREEIGFLSVKGAPSRPEF